MKPLQELLAGLPRDMDASIFVVQHRGPGGSLLEAALARSSVFPVKAAEDEEPPVSGTVYVAPPDRHLFLVEGKMRVLFGPRENLSRPSIDVLFRSAAIEYGVRVTGVVLSGALSDGACGLAAIRRCGGVSVVQDPEDAFDPELPEHALSAGAEHRVKSAHLAAFIRDAASSPGRSAVRVPSDIEMEGRAALAAMTKPAQLIEVGEHTQITCPECEGPLRRIGGAGFDRYRCHIGHAYDSNILFGAQGLQVERALWVAYRTLLERARMLEGLIRETGERGRQFMAAGYEQRLAETREHVEALRQTLSAGQSPGTHAVDRPGGAA